MGGGLMQLVAYGAQDIYLTGNPQITFFKVVYRRHTNFSMESIQQTWNGGSNSSSGRCTATISRNGDLVHKLYFQIDTQGGDSTQASFTTCDNPGCAWIDTVSVEIGGQTIDKQYGSWLETWAELTEVNPTGVIAGIDENASITNITVSPPFDFSNTLFQRMAGMGGVVGGVQGLGREQLNSGRYLYVPLQFWFCRNPGLALPLIALQYHEVKIIVEHKFGSVFETSKADQQLWADYIYLDTDERRRFAQVSHEYLIEQLQMQDTSATSTVDLNFNHPVKELIWTGQWAAAGATGGHNTTLVGAAAASSDTYLLKLNGHDRFAARPVTYFTQAQVHQYHSGPGGLNVAKYSNADGVASGSLVNNFDDSIAVYSFALKPEEHQPSGTCNFSRIDSAQLIRSGTSQAMRIYAVNYNVLRIMSGMGGLAYSN